MKKFVLTVMVAVMVIGSVSAQAAGKVKLKSSR